MSNNRLHNRISDMESSSEFCHVFDNLVEKVHQERAMKELQYNTQCMENSQEMKDLFEEAFEAKKIAQNACDGGIHGDL